MTALNTTTITNLYFLLRVVISFPLKSGEDKVNEGNEGEEDIKEDDPKVGESAGKKMTLFFV